MFTREIIYDFFKYNSEYINLPIILLGGDIGSSIEIISYFYKAFQRQYQQIIYINKKTMIKQNYIKLI